MDQVQPQHQVRIKHSFRVQTKKAKLRWVDMDLVNEKPGINPVVPLPEQDVEPVENQPEELRIRHAALRGARSPAARVLLVNLGGDGYGELRRGAGWRGFPAPIALLLAC